MTLTCPKCKSELYEIYIEGTYLYLCNGCKGMWFDKDKLIYYLQAHEIVPDNFLGKDILRPTTYFCPRCSESLKEMMFAEGHDLLIDWCPRCHGVWLDNDEFKKAKQVAEKIDNSDSEIGVILQHWENEEILLKESNRIRPMKMISVIIAGLALLWIVWGMFRPKQSVVSETPQQPIAVSPIKLCDSCGGTGKKYKKCSICNGTGKFVKYQNVGTAICQNCKGTGKLVSPGSIQCFKCNGTAWIQSQPAVCNKCNGTGRSEVKKRETCSSCYGSGQMKVRETCPICGGSGSSPLASSSIRTCSNCAGSGKIETKKSCPYCAGGIVERIQHEICPECKGRGSSISERKVCDNCFGTGQMESSESLSCRVCNGTGKVSIMGSEVCPQCQGKGGLGEEDCSSCLGRGIIKI